jgi:hypothetical protein
MVRTVAFVLSVAVGSALGAAMGNLALGIAVSFAVATGFAMASIKGTHANRAKRTL